MEATEKNYTHEQFQEQRNLWTAMFGIMCAGLFIFTYL